MSFVTVVVSFLFLFSINVTSIQINLDLTDVVDNNESNIAIQHDCLHVPAWKSQHNMRELISYCMNEWSSKWNITINSVDEVFTFADLSYLNITSQQLYLWSAPMDIIEKYQVYLDERSISNQSLMSAERYYNCTLPRFGPMCQYSFDNYESDHLSLNETLYDFYLKNSQSKRNQTCYQHLQCNLGDTLLCIGWDNICDGIIQCIDGVDEDHCWQLEINQCADNEYRCKNGQCIPTIFLKDNSRAPDCLDGSDEFALPGTFFFDPIGPPFRYNELVCLGKAIFYPRDYTESHCPDVYASSIKTLLFWKKPNSMYDICWLALMCYFKDFLEAQVSCADICQHKECQEKIATHCPTMFYMPSAPVAFGHIYFAYTKQYIIKQTKPIVHPEYVCYNELFCNGFDSNNTTILFNNSTCRKSQEFLLEPPLFFNRYWLSIYIASLYNDFGRCNTILRKDLSFCNKSVMYQCINSSKCIPKIRLFDSIRDCDYGDDESLTLMYDTDFTESLSITTHFKCTIGKKIISQKLTGPRNVECHCGYDEYGLCDDYYQDLNYIREYISFPKICDDVVDLKPILIDGKNETDETECSQSQWLCNNTYTRCNGIWNCFNGEDETDCYPSSLMNCPQYNHLCLSSDTGKYMCLSLNKTNDGNIDCLGATDERQNCPLTAYSESRDDFFCRSGLKSECTSAFSVCVRESPCLPNEQEKLCVNRSSDVFFNYDKCYNRDNKILSDVDVFLCDLFLSHLKPKIIYFSLETMVKANMNKAKRDIKMISSDYSTSARTLSPPLQCHRSIPLRVWLNSQNNESIVTCLCSPNSYGDKCQYQNQRINLMIQFQSYSDSWQTPFLVIVTLIDNIEKRIIHSHHQFTYIPVPNCKTKYLMDLLYSTRPKDQSKQYSIHIDIYNKLSLSYQGSLLLSLNYSFLPVERISTLLYIPPSDDDLKICSNPNCIHGECIQYFNAPKNTTFCKCHQGWSGEYCTIKTNCSCSSNSICLGILPNNRSICVCPINKWGSRCLFHDEICQLNNPCENNGQCIPVDRDLVSDKQFECICPNDFFGERCEIQSNQLILSFHKDIDLSPSMFVHFIEIKENAEPENGTTFKIIPSYENSITVYWSRPFHIAFLELFFKKYYLIIVQNKYNRSTIIEKKVKPQDRCLHISEVLDKTIVQSHLIRRIKYYHKPCQEDQSLSCFYDDISENNSGYICLCTLFGDQRQSNCFEFNHQMKYDCHGRSDCKNGGKCLQDSANCPTTYMCVCPLCFYGIRCEISTNGFSLSLDAILGYHIKPYASVHRQTIVIKISIVLGITVILIGLINGILSLITFRNKEPCKTGCGYYLIGSSITTLSTIIFFTCKFSILLSAQILSLTNQSFLQFQCSSIDFFLRISLYMDQWLNSCVAMERAMTLIKGINFDKTKSIKMAKLMIPILFILTSCTVIHDPYHRRLIHEIYNDEKRIWCIVDSTGNVQKYDYAVNIFHFCVPFIINLFSAIMIIIKSARLRKAVKKNQSYNTHLREQLKQHKHLLITPVVLVILAIPRLIISFISRCMSPTGNLWLFVIGYFISFIPPMLIFFIHVFPSKMYKKEFKKTIQRYRKTIQARVICRQTI